MGKYRFRLSDMMPNAWFYKLKDMGKSRSSKSSWRSTKSIKQCSPTPTQTTSITKFNHPNKSYVYYPTVETSTEPMIRFTDPLYSSPCRNLGRASDARSSTSPCRKSSHSRRTSKRTTIYKQKNENYGCNTGDQPLYYSLSSSELGSPEAVVSMPNNDYRRKSVSVDFGPELLMFDEVGSWSSSSLRSSCSCCCRVSSSTADIIIDLNHQTHDDSSFRTKFQKLNEFDAASELELRPILTKKLPEEQIFDSSRIRKSAGKNNKYVRKVKSRRSSLSDTFAIVKSSLDPQTDFKDSMMEMIQENNIRECKDLEDLLACYLSLNCKEYHPIIVKVFQQIWLDIFCST